MPTGLVSIYAHKSDYIDSCNAKLYITSYAISTSDARAEVAEPRLFGSTESNVSIRVTAVLGSSLKDSKRQLS